jgi:hypothetical protein
MYKNVKLIRIPAVMCNVAATVGKSSRGLHGSPLSDETGLTIETFSSSEPPAALKAVGYRRRVSAANIAQGLPSVIILQDDEGDSFSDRHLHAGGPDPSGRNGRSRGAGFVAPLDNNDVTKS